MGKTYRRVSVKIKEILDKDSKMKLKELLEEVKLGEDEYIEEKIIEEIMEDCLTEDELEEGIKYFKMSKRLGKLAERLDKKSAKIQGAKELVTKTKAAAKAFETLENKYATGKVNKAQARVKYDAIKKDFKDIMTSLRKKELMTALKIGGGLVIVAGIAAAFAFGLGPLATAAGLSFARPKVGGDMASPFKQAADALKKASGAPQGKPLPLTQIFGRGALAPATGIMKRLPGLK